MSVQPIDMEVSTDAPFESEIPGLRVSDEGCEKPASKPTPKAARRARLTQELIDGLTPGAFKFYVWDSTPKHAGLGVRVGSSGSVAYVLKFNLPGKRSKWMTLKATTLAAAKIEFLEELVRFGKGAPVEEKHGDTLWQDVVNRFEKEHLKGVKPTTAASYRSALKLIREASQFKDRPVRLISYEDVRGFHQGQTERMRQGNVCVQLCKLIFDRAEAWKMRDLNTNPVDLLRKSGWVPFSEEVRDVRLNDDQLQRIGNALATMEESGKESPYPIAAVRLLFFTGRRLREILNLEWSQVDLEGRTLRIEKHKTDKDTGVLKTPLNDAALAVLQSLPRLIYLRDGVEVEHPFVLPGAQPGKPINDLKKFWGRLVKMAGLEQVENESGGLTTLRRHDLRHAHGNAAADLDMGLQTVASLLGHKDAHTSARYSKKGQNPALAASQKVSGSLATKLNRGRK